MVRPKYILFYLQNKYINLKLEDPKLENLQLPQEKTPQKKMGKFFGSNWSVTIFFIYAPTNSREDTARKNDPLLIHLRISLTLF